jgi:hypothetical protein
MATAKVYSEFSLAEQPSSARKRITVFRKARERASPAGRDEAADRKRRVTFKQAAAGRLSRSAIPSSED